MAKSDTPYTYYCLEGDHSWSMIIRDNLKPPAPDGFNLTCPTHSSPKEEAA